MYYLSGKFYRADPLRTHEICHTEAKDYEFGTGQKTFSQTGNIKVYEKIKIGSIQ